MGQKVNPHGLRVGVIKNWDSRWFEKKEDFGDTLVSDYKIRGHIKSTLQDAGVPKIEIERDSQRVRVFIHCARPGKVIGRGGADINKLKGEIEKITGRPTSVDVVEVRQPDLNAQLVAENIAGQLERRTSFRRAMKQSISRTMRLGAKGIKVSCGGRLGGAEIARTEHYHEGTIPLQTLRADIDYGFFEANTTYGKIGVKVWIYKGEVLSDVKRGATTPRIYNPASERPRRSDRRDGDRRGGGGFGGDRRGGYNNGRPQGGYNSGRPQGGFNNSRPQGGFNSGRPQGGDRPISGDPRRGGAGGQTGNPAGGTSGTPSGGQGSGGFNRNRGVSNNANAKKS